MDAENAQVNPWERAMLMAGAPKARISSMSMKAGLDRIKERKCPRCGGQMGTVMLASGHRECMYCYKDRVVIPLPIEG